MLDMPYFMNNPDWYYYDYDAKKYKLTDKAPQKAQDSYKKFIKALKEGT